MKVGDGERLPDMNWEGTGVDGSHGTLGMRTAQQMSVCLVLGDRADRGLQGGAEKANCPKRCPPSLCVLDEG